MTLHIVIAVLVFSVIVIIHEIGHFAAARKCGILVEEFAIGMGPKLFAVRRGETLYTLRLFPLGGSCRMLGDEETPKSGDEQDGTAKVVNERSFTSKSVPKRLIVISAGIIMNVLLAFAVTFASLIANGFIDTKIGSLIPGYPADAASLQSGDRISRINGRKVYFMSDIQSVMEANTGESITLEIQRDGKKFETIINPILVTDAETGAQQYKIGFNYMVSLGMLEKVDDQTAELYDRAGFADTLRMSAITSIYYVKFTFESVGSLITRKVSVNEFSGPIGLVNFIGDTYEQSITVSPWVAFWNMMTLMAMLSANLAVFNFLPLPALDGGRIIFLLIEIVRGKPINPEKEGLIHFAGFVLLMIFAVFVAYNDILKLI